MSDDFLAHCRSSLEKVDCPWVVEMPDSELEVWLFKPGPQHNKALMWALTKIDPDIREYFNSLHDQDLEREIVKLFVFSGLAKSGESDKVLGRAPKKMQKLFWEGVLYQLSVLHDFEADENRENFHSDITLSSLSSLISNSNFWDLLEQEPNLLPTDIRLPPLPIKWEELQKQLAEAEEALHNIEESDTFLEQTSIPSPSNGSRQKEERIQEDIIKLVKLQKDVIDDYYKHFLQQVTTVIKKSPPNPAAEQLAQIVVTLHGNLNEFSQFLENVDKSKRIATSFPNRGLPEDYNAPKNSLHDFIATMQQQISAISAAISANDLLES